MARLASVAEYSLTGMDTSPNEMLNVPIDRAAIALPPIFFRNARPQSNGQVKFERVGAAPGSGLAEANCARGAAIADFDGDGKLDAIVANLDAAPSLLKNVAPDKNNWLALKLVGRFEYKNRAIFGNHLHGFRCSSVKELIYRQMLCSEVKGCQSVTFFPRM